MGRGGRNGAGGVVALGAATEQSGITHSGSPQNRRFCGERRKEWSGWSRRPWGGDGTERNYAFGVPAKSEILWGEEEGMERVESSPFGRRRNGAEFLPTMWQGGKRCRDLPILSVSQSENAPRTSFFSTFHNTEKRAETSSYCQFCNRRKSLRTIPTRLRREPLSKGAFFFFPNQIPVSIRAILFLHYSTLKPLHASSAKPPAEAAAPSPADRYPAAAFPPAPDSGPLPQPFRLL